MAKDVFARTGNGWVSQALPVWVAVADVSRRRDEVTVALPFKVRPVAFGKLSNWCERVTGASVQVKAWLALVMLSVAETVTLKVPVAVGVPVIAPVAALIESPAGRPVAENASVAPAGAWLVRLSDTASPV